MRLYPWAKWKARDENGDVHAFENKPVARSDVWETDTTCSTNPGRWVKVSCGRKIFPGWRETLSRTRRLSNK